MKVSGQRHATAHFTPGERPAGTHWVEGSVGPMREKVSYILTYSKNRI